MENMVQAVMPFDPVEERPYVNAIGSTEKEAVVNLGCVEMTDEVRDRLVFLNVGIMYDPDENDALIARSRVISTVPGF